MQRTLIRFLSSITMYGTVSIAFIYASSARFQSGGRDVSIEHNIMLKAALALILSLFHTINAVTSFSNILDDNSENIYENYAVIASQGVAGTPVEDADSTSMA